MTVRSRAKQTQITFDTQLKTTLKSKGIFTISFYTFLQYFVFFRLVVNIFSFNGINGNNQEFDI